jgi:hypothetical protein
MLLDDLLTRCARRPALAKHLFDPPFDIESECLRLLARGPASSHHKQAMSVVIKVHHLQSSLLRLPVASDGSAKSAATKDEEESNSDVVGRMKPLAIMRWALTSMKLITQGPIGTRGCMLTGRQARDIFSGRLHYLMKSMRSYLENMEPGTMSHDKYVLYVQQICADIQIYCTSIRPLEYFFQQSGIHYWPPRSDPQRFAPFTKAFALDLAGANPHRVAKSLYYHLQTSFDGALTEGRLQQHSRNLQKTMEEPSFLRFVLDELLAPTLEMGFGVRSFPGGWLFCMTYLPVLASQLRILFLDHEKASAIVTGGSALAEIYRWTIKAVETVMFYIQLHQLSFYDIEIGMFDTRYQETLAVAFDFWTAVLPGLRRYQGTLATSDTNFDTLNSTFQHVGKNIRSMLNGQNPEPSRRLLTSTSKFRGAYYEEFRHGLEQYVLDNWVLASGEDGILMKKDGIKVMFGPVDGSKVGALPVKSVGVRRPGLRRALIEYEQGLLDETQDRLRRSLMAVI